MTDFFGTMRRYLLEYLPKQKCFSKNTIRSYKQALNLFVAYLRTVQKMSVFKINFEAMNRELILGFLDWLETERNCGANTRNHRLMVLRSFFDYAGILDCTHIVLSVTTKKIPIKKVPQKVVPHLSEKGLEILLEQPMLPKKTELRNQFFMILMYDTAARVDELLAMKVRSLRLDVAKPIAYLHGKGNKERIVPLLDRTVQHCRNYLQKFHPNEPPDSEKHLFYTVIRGIQGEMSPDTPAEFFKKYAKTGHRESSEVPEHIHPHMLRHTRAMHLYHQGMPIMLLSEYLGHASVESTKIYAYADTEMKRAAIDKADIRKHKESSPESEWFNDEETILRLAGLLD